VNPTSLPALFVSYSQLLNSANPNAVPDEVCFGAIKAGVDALPPGVKAFLNTGECLVVLIILLWSESLISAVLPTPADFYDPNRGPGNLEMLSRFFAEYPDYVDKIFVSVKGGFSAANFGIDCS
jgi:pyridoxine 4-dehydrogenase